MPKGKKTCPSCKTAVGCPTKRCACGHKFASKKKSRAPKKAPKPHFEERRLFVERMLEGSKAPNWALEMTVATEIFENFKGDLDFLSKVKPPFKLKGSLTYFRTQEGKKYLNKKHLEFLFKPPELDKFIDAKKKAGEDILEHKTKTLRDFLYE